MGSHQRTRTLGDVKEVSRCLILYLFRLVYMEYLYYS